MVLLFVFVCVAAYVLDPAWPYMNPTYALSLVLELNALVPI